VVRHLELALGLEERGSVGAEETVLAVPAALIGRGKERGVEECAALLLDGVGVLFFPEVP
jgi:hypothetical protein